MCQSTSHLRCDFSVKGASVRCCSFSTLSSFRASFDWTLGCLNRWRHWESNRPCNAPLGLPPCFYRSTWRICFTTVPCGSHDNRKVPIVPRLRLLLPLFAPHSNHPLLSTDYPDCCILSGAHTAQMLPYSTCSLIISNSEMFFISLFLILKLAM